MILSEVGGAAEAGGTRVPWGHHGWGRGLPPGAGQGGPGPVRTGNSQWGSSGFSGGRIFLEVAVALCTREEVGWPFMI